MHMESLQLPAAVALSQPHTKFKPYIIYQSGVTGSVVFLAMYVIVPPEPKFLRRKPQTRAGCWGHSDRSSR